MKQTQPKIKGRTGPRINASMRFHEACIKSHKDLYNLL